MEGDILDVDVKAASLANWVTAATTALSVMIAIVATWIAMRAKKSADRAADAAERSADSAEQTLRFEREGDFRVPPPTVGPSSMAPDGIRRRFLRQPPPPSA